MMASFELGLSDMADKKDREMKRRDLLNSLTMVAGDSPLAT